MKTKQKQKYASRNLCGGRAVITLLIWLLIQRSYRKKKSVESIDTLDFVGVYCMLNVYSWCVVYSWCFSFSRSKLFVSLSLLDIPNRAYTASPLVNPITSYYIIDILFLLHYCSLSLFNFRRQTLSCTSRVKNIFHCQPIHLVKTFPSKYYRHEPTKDPKPISINAPPHPLYHPSVDANHENTVENTSRR